MATSAKKARRFFEIGAPDVEATSIETVTFRRHRLRVVVTFHTRESHGKHRRLA